MTRRRRQVYKSLRSHKVPNMLIHQPRHHHRRQGFLHFQGFQNYQEFRYRLCQ
jgi:hypothetical protein